MSAAQAEAASAGVNIVDDYNTITHTDGTCTFNILRCGFYMDLFYLFAFITFLHAVYSLIMHGASHRLVRGLVFHACVYAEAAHWHSSAFPGPLASWAVSGRQNLTSRSPIKARLALLHSSSQLLTRGFLVRLAPLRKYSFGSLTFVLTGS